MRARKLQLVGWEYVTVLCVIIIVVVVVVVDVVAAATAVTATVVVCVYCIVSSRLHTHTHKKKSSIFENRLIVAGLAWLTLCEMPET